MADVNKYVIPALDFGLHWNKKTITFSIPKEGSTWSYEGNPDSQNYTVGNL